MHQIPVFDRSGYTSVIYALDEDPPRVCKAFTTDRAHRLFQTEKDAYERFSAQEHPSSILKYYGVHSEIPLGIILECAEKKNLSKYLWDTQVANEETVDSAFMYCWAHQAAEALEFAHSLGVFNSDIHCINFFLDGDLNLKVGDWAGASIDGSRSQSSYRLRHRLFDAEGNDIPRQGISAITEVFALGTALFCIAAGHDPWPELHEPGDRTEIMSRISRKAFPDTTSLPALGTTIRKCWHLEVTTMTEVKNAVALEADAYLSSQNNISSQED